MLCPALIRAAQNGDAEAIAQVLDGLEGMIYRLAEKQIRHRPGFTDRMEDLRQEGRVAVLEALTSHDPARGSKFSTYAHHYIRGAMSFATNPASGPTVSDETLATFKGCLAIVGGDMEAAEYLATILPGAGHRMSPATAHLARLSLEGVESLDAPAGEESFLLGEVLADPHALGVPADLAEPSDLARQDRERKAALAHALLKTLNGNAERVVRMVFGFDPEPHLHNGYDARGLPVPDHAAIAEALGITQVTSRQTLKRALDRLRATVESLALEGADLDVELAA
ncbi:sigma-70 family RNA polymerase sigma factor [Streptomyces noursei]|uniref:sigma-70 family RNA polymerase sigma factor n=1 Tax=Streptomyces noursei TaxID=1971 RepID=UPI00081C6C33|nr:RNA polymerase sigma factor, sigma-70 family [Streptomyces noursei ATCC 11455]MCZ0996339.1 sigma-70 family RNA polymerase sigma factor [Streptomyces noursei]